MSDIDVDVLIVGGGGAGLSASIFLQGHGVDHLLVERNPSTSELPKAHYLNARTLEIFRQHGLDDDVYDVGMPLGDCKVRFCTSLGGDGPLDARELYVYDAFGGGRTRDRYARVSPGPPTNLPQIRLEPLLRRVAEERSPGRVRFGHEVFAFTQDESGVTIEVRDAAAGSTYTVRARYVISADGGRTLGPQLGVKMEGTPDALASLVSNHVTADLSAHVPGDALITHFTAPGTRFWWGALVAMGPTWGKASEEWSVTFAYHPDDPNRLAPGEIEDAIREMFKLPDLELTVHRTSEWQVNAVVADRFGVGRVFLAGDAAHKHVPTAGLGLNSAIHDTHNLAWKLALVLSGKADASLLASYDHERRAADLVNADWALFTFFNHAQIDAGLGISPMAPPEVNAAAMTAYFADSPMGETLRARAHQVLDTQRTEYEAIAIELGFGYESSAVVPDGTTPPPRDPMGCEYAQTARPGHRLPHAWLDGPGGRASTHDLVGPRGGFALITGADGDAWAAAAQGVAEEVGIDLVVAAIGEGAPYRDVDGVWATSAGIGGHGAVLVRPDNHVAFRAGAAVTDPESVLRTAFAQLLGAGQPAPAGA